MRGGALEPILIYLLNLDFDGEMCLNKRIKSQIVDYIFGYQEEKTMSSLSYAILNFIWYSAQQNERNVERLFEILSIELKDYVEMKVQFYGVTLRLKLEDENI